MGKKGEGGLLKFGTAQCIILFANKLIETSPAFIKKLVPIPSVIDPWKHIFNISQSYLSLNHFYEWKYFLKQEYNTITKGNILLSELSKFQFFIGLSQKTGSIFLYRYD